MRNNVIGLSYLFLYLVIFATQTAKNTRFVPLFEKSPQNIEEKSHQI